MFSEREKTISRIVNNIAPTLVSADLTIVGDVNGDGEVQIDGRIIGSVQATTIVVGDHGQIQGDIAADVITIRGSVDGNIVGRAVFVSATAKVRGSIFHTRLSLEKGASFEGRCQRIGGNPSPKSDVVIPDAPPSSVAGLGAYA